MTTRRTKAWGLLRRDGKLHPGAFPRRIGAALAKVGGKYGISKTLKGAKLIRVEIREIRPSGRS